MTAMPAALQTLTPLNHPRTAQSRQIRTGQSRRCQGPLLPKDRRNREAGGARRRSAMRPRSALTSHDEAELLRCNSQTAHRRRFRRRLTFAVPQPDLHDPPAVPRIQMHAAGPALLRGQGLAGPGPRRAEPRLFLQGPRPPAADPAAARRGVGLALAEIGEILDLLRGRRRRAAQQAAKSLALKFQDRIVALESQKVDIGDADRGALKDGAAKPMEAAPGRGPASDLLPRAADYDQMLRRRLDGVEHSEAK